MLFNISGEKKSGHDEKNTDESGPADIEFSAEDVSTGFIIDEGISSWTHVDVDLIISQIVQIGHIVLRIVPWELAASWIDLDIEEDKILRKL